MIPRDTGVELDGIAESEAEHLGNLAHLREAARHARPWSNAGAHPRCGN